MKRTLFGLLVAAGLAATAVLAADAATAKPPLGLPPVPIPADNLQTPEKIALGDKLFDDKRFSSTGQVACATCHDAKKAFTDSPLRTSEGIKKAGKALTGTRNAPTVVNAAYFDTHVLGRPLPEPRGPVAAPLRQPRRDGPQGPPADPEDRPVRPRVREGLRAGLRQEGRPGHHEGGQQAIARLRADQGVRRTRPSTATSTAASRRRSPTRRSAASTSTSTRAAASPATGSSRRRPSSPTTASTTSASGINDIQKDVPALAGEFLQAKATLAEVDVKVLGDKRTSELGRFAISRDFEGLGAFKTPTLRNVAVTSPYMHDGSLKTLKDVVVHYNNGGVTKEGDPVNDFLSGGIRPLNLTEQEIDDLVSFMEALTSPEFAALPSAARMEVKP